jgi:endonuclease G
LAISSAIHLFTNELALRVHVERKLPPEVFKDRPRELIPKNEEEASLDQQYLLSNGRRVPLDVIEADYKLVQLAEPPRPRAVLEKPRERSEVNGRRRVDPLVGGVSIGSPQVPVGTLGALVWDRIDGSICILSNWHVLAGDLHAEVGNPCYQPGLFDQGRSTDVIAHLKRWSFNRKTDAAIAELNGSRRYCTGEILSMFQTIKDVAPYLYLGMKVHKSGRSSDHSWGFIDGLYFSAAIEYSNGFVRVFEEQIHIAPLENKPISEPGDSGSVWVTNAQDEGYLAVGLHFAGDLPHSSFGEYALANPMSVVARRLNFSFRPLFFEVRDEEVMSLPQSSTSQAVKIQIGNGVQPMSIVLNGPTGSGSQPVDDKMGPGGG